MTTVISDRKRVMQNVWTLIPAPHRRHHVRPRGQLVGELLRRARGKIDAPRRLWEMMSAELTSPQSPEH